MRSSDYEYRVVTAYGNRFGYEYRPIDSDAWINANASYETVNNVIERIDELIKRDDFEPQVVEID